MPSPYVAEVQTARWTSDAVRQAFRDAGFSVTEWPLTQHLEKQLPADAIFFSRRFSKLFGFQYKTVYRNGKDHWPLDPNQHRRLRVYPWIYYCCSELRDPADHGLALHFARIYATGFGYQPRLSGSSYSEGQARYIRWGAFYQQLKQCRAGLRVTSRTDFADAVGTLSGNARLREVVQMGDVLLADFDRRAVLVERLF